MELVFIFSLSPVEHGFQTTLCVSNPSFFKSNPRAKPTLR
ncbi:hypothetical protein MCC93_11980 [Morococcus cerebrosus]|uniref:Uncharacterized protein n=1 Tax=Morococcus cerebrosus TaxID=1056807 RepID=A0A0C1EIA6_9NEIS|nr:hypothetical protein MCC93_11980 [Morococcus cerebrosus]